MSAIRQRLIDATFEEVFSKGYQAASLSSILNKANTQKGSMYHHFSSKKVMVLAMIEEKLQQRIEKKWEPLLKTQSVISSLLMILNDINSWDLKQGCPLGNLLQESLNDDEEFSQLLTQILNAWRELFESILVKAQENGEIGQNEDIKECATFLIASIEGALLMTKKYQSEEPFIACMNQLTFYIKSLKDRYEKL